jgi:hypothetical protein
MSEAGVRAATGAGVLVAPGVIPGDGVGDGSGVLLASTVGGGSGVSVGRAVTLSGEIGVDGGTVSVGVADGEGVSVVADPLVTASVLVAPGVWVTAVTAMLSWSWVSPPALRATKV